MVWREYGLLSAIESFQISRGEKYILFLDLVFPISRAHWVYID